MEQFAELNVSGPASALARLLAAIRRPDAHKHWRPVHDERFDYAPHSGVKARLWLTTNPERLSIANVTPPSVGDLSVREYNHIVRAFHDDVIAPAASAEPSVSVTLTSGQATVDDLLPQAAALRLRAFLAYANVGALHAFDRQRWHDFVIALHRSGAYLDSDVLRRLLIEDYGWPDSDAADLASDFEDELALLRRLREPVPA